MIPVTGQLGQKKRERYHTTKAKEKAQLHVHKSPLTLQSFLTCISPYLLVTNSGKQN